MDLFWQIFFAVVFCWILNFVFVKPYLRLLYYKKKGAYTYYFPIIGIFARCQKDVKSHNDFYHFSKNLIKTRPDLKVIATNFGSKVVLQIIDQLMSKEVFQNYQRYTKTSFLGVLKPVMGGALVMIEGERWKVKRRLSAKAFEFDYLKTLIPSIQQLTNKTLAEWKTQRPGKEIDILESLQKLIGGIFTATFFGVDSKGFNIEGKSIEVYFSKLMADYGSALLSPLVILLGNKAARYLSSHYRKLNINNVIFRKYAKDIIRERRKQFEAKSSRIKSGVERNLLDILFECQESQKDFTDDELVDDFAAFFAGGTDTSAHLLQSLFYYLEQYPEYKGILVEEVKRVIKDPNQQITLGQLNQLDFTTATIKEALRMVPPIPQLTQREVIVDHYIGDLYVPKGTYVLVDFVTINHHPKLFANPEKFNPYRWIKGHQDFNEEANKDPFIFTPFSAGPRNCIGQPLAMLEMKLILALFVHHFNWKVKDGYKLQLAFKFGYEPSQHIPLILDPLNN